MFGGTVADGVEILAEVFGLDLLELAGDAQERHAQILHLEHGQQQITCTHLCIAKFERGVSPGPFNGHFDILGEVADRGCPAWQAVERSREILGDDRTIKPVVADDVVQIRILRLQQLGEPVLQLDVGIAA